MAALRSSYDWVREIDPNLKKHDAIPLTGASPPFPWTDFSSRLGIAFDKKNLHIQPGELTWRSKQHLLDGMGDTPVPLVFSVPPLQGEIHWIMPAQEVDILASLLLTKETHPLTLHDPELSESFYRFLALEVIYQLTQVSLNQSLTPILTHQSYLPNQDSLCWDIAIQLQGQNICGRLVISPAFRQSWVEHFAVQQENTALSQEIAAKVDVFLHAEIGKTFLSLEEWQSVQTGDLILLDICSLDSERIEGRMMLTLHNKPVFRAKLKKGTLKILELPILQEVENSMINGNNEQDEEEHEEESELDLSTEEETLNEDTDDLFSETEEESQFFDDTTEEDHEEETEAHLEDDLIEEVSSTEEQVVPSVQSKPIVPEQIPVTLIIEVGQVKLTMEQLLKLEPGNMLEINMHPENSVDITINGKIVGRGELLRIGETLGVRVLQLGK